MNNNKFDWGEWFEDHPSIFMGILIHFAMYLFFSFITMDLNPIHWMIFKNEIGRLIFVICEIFVIGYIIDEYE